MGTAELVDEEKWIFEEALPPLTHDEGLDATHPEVFEVLQC